MPAVEFGLTLLVMIAALTALAAWLRLPYPIVYILGGMALDFVPGVPDVSLPPDAVFLVFVPPLVFVAAFFTSWRDFRAEIRSILLLAVGLVTATIVVVAAAAHQTFGGMPWVAAFVLGAVVANTDTTAVEAVAQQVGLPRRLLTILEGESLTNDAVALTAFRMAIIAAVTGTFSTSAAALDLGIAIIGAIPIGLAVGWVTARIRFRVQDSRVVIVIGMVTPYAAYLPAEWINASGILAVVVAGLYLGRRESLYEGAETRLQARAFWEVLIFILNGALFILVGSELRPTWEGLRHHDFSRLAGSAALVCMAVIGARLVWVALTTYVPQWLGRSDLTPAAGWTWRHVLLLGWAGPRGADTLVASLSVPLLTQQGAPFPARAEIIYLTFAVVVVTVIGQGLTLPLLVKRLALADDNLEEQEEVLARRAAAEAALARLGILEQEGKASAKALEMLRRHYKHQLKLVRGEVSPATLQQEEAHIAVRRDLLQTERNALVRLRDEGVISDQVLRRVQEDIDLEEAIYTPD